MRNRNASRDAPRGSALIVVLLVLLALSALGIMALRTVGNSIDRSGSYRVRASATDFADAAARYFIHDAPRYAATMNKTSQHEMNDSTASFSDRNRLASSGGYVHLKQERSGGNRAFNLPSNHPESGLFTDGQSNRDSFEGQNADSNFEIMLRYPSHPITMPGYSEDFCFRKVTIASQAALGDFSGTWDSNARVGQGRTIAEGFVPLTDCK